MDAAPDVTPTVLEQVRDRVPAEVYLCRCKGFSSQRIEEMCLRCLDAYVSGIQLLLTPKRLEREMRRVAKVLLRELKDGPRVTLGQALRAADRGLQEDR